ncbi:type IV toxin-antitoxin system AbiEi family antitoxin [Methylonatrum kenyense]|uniref:type IV toxin-antitoxin system AbiEi family antitoxin domain-containing protein n=1 Tax=Methylonatrum kenyense TaxID=455253 RepID=UPI0020C0FED3|nr:type IV toxin-antitoxin system AbiEi family antitoxin domain-containing protein [Methylonatrum kenyense]MCK8515001.1 type IV toxin-antitoxin system AbiEi family antitoxin [Methylonatrum kenyense]
MKINQLLREIPYGAVVTTAWLGVRGVSTDQARKLTRSGWLRRVGHGAYCRAGDSLTWESAVFALQASSGSRAVPIWPGGQTALSLHGFNHYLALGFSTRHIFGGAGARLPRWFRLAEWTAETNLHTVTALPAELPDSFADHAPANKGFTLQISTPERAVLEWITVAPDELLFGSALVDTFSGLNTLRPRRLQVFLEACRSVRTKRAFLVLARHAGHNWYGRLDPTRLDLGQGKRQLYPGGRLDREFQVTVPEEFARGV